MVSAYFWIKSIVLLVLPFAVLVTHNILDHCIVCPTIEWETQIVGMKNYKIS